MKKILLLVTFAILYLTGKSQTIDKEIKISGLAYSPDVVEINKGQIVSIEASISHPLVQVSKETWEANGTTLVVDGNETTLGLIREFNTPGIYYFVCKNHAGSFSMKCKVIVLDPTGIEDQMTDTKYEIYPNPTNSNLTIRFSQPIQVQSIRLVNLEGIDVFNQEINLNIANFTLNSEGLANGFYQIVIHTFGKTMYHKVVVR